MRVHRDLQHTLRAMHFLRNCEHVALIATAITTAFTTAVVVVVGVHRLKLEWAQEVARVGGFLPDVEGVDMGGRQCRRERGRGRVR